MYVGEELLERELLLGGQAEDAVHLIGPERAVLGHVKAPVPDVGDPLRGEERALALPQCRLCPLALGYVAQVDDDAPNVGVVEQVVANTLEMPPGTVRVPQARLERRAVASHGDELGVEASDPFAVIRVQKVCAVLADQV